MDVVLVMRDHYSGTAEALARIARWGHEIGRILVLPGGMSERERRRLRRVDDPRIEFLGPRRHLSPSEGRAIGLDAATSDLVMLLDNDVEIEEHSVLSMLAAATRTGAWLVRPILHERLDGRELVHDAGGICRLETTDGLRRIRSSHSSFRQPADSLGSISSGPCGFAEFHALLVDARRLAELGGIDTGLRSAAEHLDLILRVRGAGGCIWLDAESRATFIEPEHLRFSDLSFFLGRWSPNWNRRTRSHLEAKYALSEPGDPSHTWRFPERQRLFGWMTFLAPLRPLTTSAQRFRIAEIFDRLLGRHIADLLLTLDPLWQPDRDD